jgi:hypothetical protein
MDIRGVIGGFSCLQIICRFLKFWNLNYVMLAVLADLEPMSSITKKRKNLCLNEL